MRIIRNDESDYNDQKKKKEDRSSHTEAEMPMKDFIAPGRI